MKYNNHIPQQELIDYSLGTVSADKQTEIAKHIEQCHSCKKELQGWQHIFSEQEKSDHQPTPALKERLWQSIEEVQDTPSENKRRPAFFFAVAGIAAIFSLMISLYMSTNSPNPSVEMVQNAEISDSSIQEHPETKQMSITPVANFNHVKGNIWINNTKEELLLEVDGLTRLSKGEYQLWIIYDNNTIEGVLLPIKNGSSRVFFKGEDVNQFKSIKASVEPIGGSTEQTGPDTFIVDLKN